MDIILSESQSAVIQKQNDSDSDNDNGNDSNEWISWNGVMTTKTNTNKASKTKSKVKVKREYTTLRIYHNTKDRLMELCSKRYNYSEFLDILMDVYNGELK